MPDPDTLRSLVARLAHYFSHVDRRQITIAIDGALSDAEAVRCIERPHLPPGFCAETLPRIEAIRDAITFARHADTWSEHEGECDVLLLWQASARERPPWREIARHHRHNRTLFEVDWTASRTDGIWFAEAAMAMSRSSRRFDDDAATQFQTRTCHLRGATTAYLVATGPSARSALDVDMADGVRIACNTVILDDDLVRHVDPHIVTFADPIFHFGPSTYAAAFQRALATQAEHHDFTIVTVERYAELLAARLPHLADRIVGVRQGTTSWSQNLDLFDELAVRPYPNIFTMLMLPLAATFADDVLLFGFDGRATSETYYWRHGTTVQFGQELDDVRLVHPGFFALDYAGYYHQHLRDVEDLFVAMEQRGISVRAHTPSMMSPVRRRSDPVAPADLDDGVVGPSSAERVIVSLAPDWIDGFGHHGPWERAVGSAARRAGFGYLTLSSRAQEPSAPGAIPTFSHGTLSRLPLDTTSFEVELRAALDRSIDPTTVDHVVFYTADLWHLPPLLRLACDHPATLFAVNLMRAHAQIVAARDGDTRWALALRTLLRETLQAAKNTNLVVCVDTLALVDDVHAATGMIVPAWPMVIVGDQQALRRVAGERPEHPRCIVAPIQSQSAKGVGEVEALAKRFSERLQRGELSLVTRLACSVDGPSTSDLRRSDHITRLGGEVVEGSLSDEQYAALIGRADVVLLPYQADTFRTRTSGVVLDAVAAGKPIVTVQGTWAGELVEKNGIGMTYQEGDLDELVEVLCMAGRGLARLTGEVAARKDGLLAEFQPERLIEFLVGHGSERGGRPPRRSDVDRVGTLASTMLDVHWDRHVREARAAIAHSVALDDLQRRHDDSLDRIERLDRCARARQQPPAAAEATVDIAPAAPGSPPTEPLTATCAGSVGVVARIVQRRVSTPGRVVDVGTSDHRCYRTFLDAGWTVYTGDCLRSGRRLIAVNGRADSARLTVRRLPLRPPPAGAEARAEAHVDLLVVAESRRSASVLGEVPWERQRPDAVIAAFDDVALETDTTGRDIAELLLAYGYQVWVSRGRRAGLDAGEAARYEVCSYPDEGFPCGERGCVIAFIDPVSVRVMAAAGAAG